MTPLVARGGSLIAALLVGSLAGFVVAYSDVATLWVAGVSAVVTVATALLLTALGGAPLGRHGSK